MSTSAAGRLFNTKPSPWQPLNQGKRSAARKRILDGGGGGSATAAATTSPSSGTGPAHKYASTLSSIRAELANASAADAASGAGGETPALSSAAAAAVVAPPSKTAHVRRRSSFDDSMYSDRQLRRNSLLPGAGRGGESSPARPPHGHGGGRPSRSRSVGRRKPSLDDSSSSSSSDDVSADNAARVEGGRRAGRSRPRIATWDLGGVVLVDASRVMKDNATASKSMDSTAHSDFAVDGSDHETDTDADEEGVDHDSGRGGTRTVTPSSTERQFERITRKLDAVEAKLAAAESEAKNPVSLSKLLGWGADDDDDDDDGDDPGQSGSAAPRGGGGDNGSKESVSIGTGSSDNRSEEAVQHSERGTADHTRLHVDRSRRRVRERESIAAKIVHDQGRGNAVQPSDSDRHSNDDDEQSIGLGDIAESAAAICDSGRFLVKNNTSTGHNSSSSLSGYIVVKQRGSNSGDRLQADIDGTDVDGITSDKQQQRPTRRRPLNVDAEDIVKEGKKETDPSKAKGSYLRRASHHEVHERGPLPSGVSRNDTNKNVAGVPMHPGGSSASRTGQGTTLTQDADASDFELKLELVRHRTEAGMCPSGSWVEPDSAAATRQSSGHIFNTMKGRRPGKRGGLLTKTGSYDSSDIATIVSQADTVQVSNRDPSKNTLQLQPHKNFVQTGTAPSSTRQRNMSINVSDQGPQINKKNHIAIPRRRSYDQQRRALARGRNTREGTRRTSDPFNKKMEPGIALWSAAEVASSPRRRKSGLRVKNDSYSSVPAGEDSPRTAPTANNLTAGKADNVLASDETRIRDVSKRQAHQRSKSAGRVARPSS